MAQSIRRAGLGILIEDARSSPTQHVSIALVRQTYNTSARDTLKLMGLALHRGLEQLKLAGATVSYVAAWQPAEQADRWMSALFQEIPWTQHQVKTFGKLRDSPRLSSWHGDADASYSYSGSRYQPTPWTKTLSEIRTALRESLQTEFNGVLVNRYRSGTDSMGWHADNERELGPDPVIASISLGAERRFSLKHRTDGQRLQLHLAHGSLLLMAGQTQRNWLHALPKQHGVEAERINLTFRRLLIPG